MAHAIGKPVVLVSETMDDVPFDLQQLRVILYDKDDPVWGEKLAKNITASVKETLTNPIEAVPNIFRKKVKSQAPEQDATIARLEVLEKQVRMLRSAQPSRHLKMSPSGELAEVRTPGDLEDWITRWHSRGLPSETLAVLIKRADNIPPEEAARVKTLTRGP